MRVHIFQWSIWEVRNVKFCVKRELNFWKNGLQVWSAIVGPARGIVVVLQRLHSSFQFHHLPEVMKSTHVGKENRACKQQSAV